MAKTLASLMVVIGAKTSAFEKALKKQEKALKKFGRVATSAGATLTKAITLPALALGAATVKSYADFEKAMVGSTAIMGDLSNEMRTKMEKTAREVAKTTRFSAIETAESYYYLASAGLDAAQSIEALPKMAAFAQAGNFDMARATDLLTDAQSALGLTIRDDVVKNMKNMVRVSDVLVKANTLSNATVEQFSESLTTKAGAALRILDKDVEEGVAVLAAFADQGLKGAAAGDALNIVLRDLQRASIKNRDQFKRFGVEVYDTDGNMRNIADVVGDLEGALSGMSDEQVRATLMTMGFQDRSVSNLMTLLSTSDAIREYERELRKAGGTTEKVANKQLQNFWDKLGLMKSRLIDVAIGLGELFAGPRVVSNTNFMPVGSKEQRDYSTLAPSIIESSVFPVLEKFITKVEELANSFANLSTEEQQNIIQMGLWVAAIGPTLWAAGQLAFAVTSLINLFMMLGGAKVIGFVIVMLEELGIMLGLSTGSVGVLMVALIGLAIWLEKEWGIISQMWDVHKLYRAQDWEKFKTQILGIWDDILYGIKWTVNQIIEAINWMTGALNEIPGINIKPISKLTLPTLGETPLPVGSKENRYPKLATGGNIFSSGMAMVGERGPEILNLPRGAQVTPLSKAGTKITININGNISSEKDADYYANYMIKKLQLAGVTP